MKFSLNWLKNYVDLTAGDDEIARAITQLGFEVEGVLRTGAPALSQVVVGEVLTRDKHPNADRLSVCTVDLGPGGGVKTIVCGAQNYVVGDRVPVALPGAILPGNFVIKQSKIRGQSSDGMMCSAKELGVAEDADGLLILTARPALGTPINAVLPPGDLVIDVEITPNRPDCLCHLGLARELAAWFKLPLKYPEEKFGGRVAAGVKPRPDLLRNVRLESPDDCPLYTAHVIAGVRVGPSPAWLQDRLRAVGLRPINNVVDVTNFVMLETGQPLHAFDAAKLGGSEIVVRPAGPGEKIVTLDGRERILHGSMLVIADASRPVVIAGIMGGMDSGVSETTTDLVLEGACFRRQSVRRTSKQLGLSSDSSYRYERGVDPHSLLEAVHRAIDLIVDTAGGHVAEPAFRVGGDIPWEREVVITAAYVRDRLGFDIPEADMRASLEALELTVTREDPTEDRGMAWTIDIPSWRDDLDRPIDLVEEILRLHGTDRIPAAPVISPALVTDDAPVVGFNRRVTEYLVGHDFHECVNYTLRSQRELATWVSQTAAAELSLANPLVEDQSHLRPTLILGLLDVLKLNQSRGTPASRLFETGRVFVEHNGQILECCGVGFVIAEASGERSWLERSPADFYAVKHHVEALAAQAGVNLAASELAPVTVPFWGWQEGQSAGAGRIEDGWSARFGLLNLAMVRELGIAGKVQAGMFAILPGKLPARAARPRFAELSIFPAATRDLAIVLDEGVTAQAATTALSALAHEAAGAAFSVESVRIFDRYQGPALAAGKKSLAFSFVFRARDRTLTDDEVNGVFRRIQDELPRRTGYQVRA